MSARLKRKLIVFNEDDVHQRELLEWCASRTNNFSGFVKDVLFAFMTGGSTVQSSKAATAIDSAAQAPPMVARYYGIGDIL